jgi:tetratricopeptide (TPR) repeat protein
MADCNEAIRLEPDVAAAFDSRGLTFLKLGQWASAITDYNAALRLDPKLPSALYGRGFARLKTGDRAGGDADIAAAEAVERNIAEKFARYGLH